MRAPTLLILALSGAALVAACDHQSPTGVDKAATANANSGTPGDTATHGGGTGTGRPPTDSGTTNPDSGSSGYHGPVQLTVRIVTYVFSPATNGGDTLSVVGVANALVEASPITSAGVGPAQQLGHTNADGFLNAGSLPSGPYVIRATPPSGAADAAQVSVNLAQAAVTVQFGIHSTGPQQ